MPTELQNPPQVSITIAGKTQAEHDAAKGGPIIQQAAGESLCARVVAPGRTVEWRGKRYTGGETVHLTPESANYNTRFGNVVHPQDFHPTNQQQVTVTELRQQPARHVQGPSYDGR